MIEFKNVSKSFGRVKALDNINQELPPGKIIGLFGPNGAGKSTFLKLIAGVNYPDQGEVIINGLTPKDNRQNMAYLPEIDHLYSWWTIEQAADFFRTVYTDWDDGKYKSFEQFLQLDKQMKLGKISKGQRAKAKLLFTVSRHAPYLLMDEPFSGIDILTREEIANALIKEYIEEQQTIIISTHEIEEIENLVEYVVFINQGNIVLSDYAEELRIEKEMSLVQIMKEAFKNAR